jgi:hypothetical protein
MKIQGRVKIYVADKCAAQRGTGQRTVGRLEHVPWQSRDLLSFLASSAGGGRSNLSSMGIRDPPWGFARNAAHRKFIFYEV